MVGAPSEKRPAPRYFLLFSGAWYQGQQFYYEDGRLLYWYIDIITHSWNEDKSSLTVIDLLADVLIYPDGFVKVVDLDELADAEEAGIITKEQLLKSLRTLDKLLGMIYSGDFKRIRDYVESFE